MILISSSLFRYISIILFIYFKKQKRSSLHDKFTITVFSVFSDGSFFFFFSFFFPALFLGTLHICEKSCLKSLLKVNSHWNPSLQNQHTLQMFIYDTVMSCLPCCCHSTFLFPTYFIKVFFKSELSFYTPSTFTIITQEIQMWWDMMSRNKRCNGQEFCLQYHLELILA